MHVIAFMVEYLSSPDSLASYQCETVVIKNKKMITTRLSKFRVSLLSVAPPNNSSNKRWYGSTAIMSYTASIYRILLPTPSSRNGHLITVCCKSFTALPSPWRPSTNPPASRVPPSTSPLAPPPQHLPLHTPVESLMLLVVTPDDAWNMCCFLSNLSLTYSQHFIWLIHIIFLVEIVFFLSHLFFTARRISVWGRDLRVLTGSWVHIRVRFPLYCWSVSLLLSGCVPTMDICIRAWLV